MALTQKVALYDETGAPLTTSVGVPVKGMPAALGQAAAAASVPVVLAFGGALTNRSGTIAAGGTAQTAAAQNASRRYLLIQAPSANTESLWVNFDGTAAVTSQPSIEFPPGLILIWDAGFVPSGAVSVIAATIGTPFVVKEA